MLKARDFALVIIASACRVQSDPGFDVVHVPATAYVMPSDGGALEGGDDGGEAGASAALVVCSAAPSEHGDDDEMSSDYDDCPLKKDDRTLDVRVTKRHRDKDDTTACCYRKGRRE